jgi:hypothetical protein
MVRRLIAAALVAIGLAACGSSSVATTASTNGTKGTTPFSAIATAHAQAHTRAQGGTASHHRSALPRPPEVPRNRMPRRRGHGAAADITGGSLVHATMTIKSGGRLSPPVIALPSRVFLKLIVVDGDGHSHTVAIGLAHVHVAAGGHALLSVRNLNDGSYSVTVDGQRDGKVTIGTAGGP